MKIFGISVARASRKKLDPVARQIAQFQKTAHGMFPRTCPLCGTESLFSSFGLPPRIDARCGHCGSLERHRLLALWVDRNPGAFGADQLVLHFAPERQLKDMLMRSNAQFETADLNPKADVTHHINIEATGLPSDRYDRIICNHVLEHVDDHKALAELYRMLKPGGFVLLMTPVVEGWAETYENPAIIEPQDRVLHFGQSDHVRMYGRDIRTRICAAGLDLDEFTAVEPDVRIYGLMRGETLFIAHKPVAVAGVSQ